MDGVTVTGLDKAKYKIIMWVRERLYERSAGYMLRDGVIPPSIRRINTFLSERPAGMFLPFEVFGNDEIYLNDGSCGFSIAITSGALMKEEGAARLQALLLEILPTEYYYQFQVFNLRKGCHYICMFSASGPRTSEARQALVKLRLLVEDVLGNADLSCRRIHPQEMIDLMAMFIDGKSANHEYDDNQLIRNQVGLNDLNLKDGYLLSSHSGLEQNRIKCYQGRRFGYRTFIPLQRFFMAVINEAECVLSFNFKTTGTALQGQFIVMEKVKQGDQPRLFGVFSQNGWLLEEDRFNVHLSLLSSFPTGISPVIYEALMKARRWSLFNEEQAGGMLPFPYVSNAMMKIQATVHSFQEAAHV